MFVICVFLWCILSKLSISWMTAEMMKTMWPVYIVTWCYSVWAQQYMFTVWVCGLVLCVCGNYCDLNAGSAGETGCLLINERSRWPRVGGSSENTASRSGGQHNTDTWAITNKTSQAADTRQRYCVYVDFSLYPWPFRKSTNRYIIDHVSWNDGTSGKCSVPSHRQLSPAEHVVTHTLISIYSLVKQNFVMALSFLLLGFFDNFYRFKDMM